MKDAKSKRGVWRFWNLRKKRFLRIQELTEYLEQVNIGGQGLLVSTTEDEFSQLQDEIYKTVTSLYLTKESALEAKNHFADNLSNIAHQLKTPITTISLIAQMMEEQLPTEYPAQIRRQINRLVHLEEALLLLSRMDAGTLALNLQSVDVFTLLTLASDNLQELSRESEVGIDVPEMGEVEIKADLDWTMEAVMNLMKNSLEHAPKRTSVHCGYEENPLYVQIKIWDEGPGFAKILLQYLWMPEYGSLESFPVSEPRLDRFGLACFKRLLPCAPCRFFWEWFSEFSVLWV